MNVNDYFCGDIPIRNIHSECGGPGSKNAAEATKKISGGIQETEKYSALKAEYITVITMAKAIFGPETRKAIDALLSASNPKVWKADAKYVENLVLAMSSELTYGLSSVPASTHAE